MSHSTCRTFPAVALLIALLMAACPGGPPQRFSLQIKYLFDSSGYPAIVDLDGDGKEEIVQFQQASTSPMNNQPNRINVYESDGLETKEQINTDNWGAVFAHKKSTYTEDTAFTVLHEKNFNYYVEEYSYDGKTVGENKLGDLTDTNKNGAWEGSLLFAGEMKRRDRDEPLLIAVVNSTYDHTPRRIVALDRNSLEGVWSSDTGILISPVYLKIIRNGEKGEDELYVGNYACANGVSAGDLKDENSYVLRYDADGSRSWAQLLGDKFTYSLIAGVDDIDQDGAREVVVLFVDSRVKDRDRIFTLSAETGIIKKSVSVPAAKQDTPLFADIDNDGRKELVFNGRDGSLFLYDNQLRAIARSDSRIGAVTVIGDILDIDGDGRQELISLAHSSGKQKVVIHDCSLRLLAETALPEKNPVWYQITALKYQDRAEKQVLLVSGNSIDRLTIVKRIVELHDGEIVMEGAVGKGTVVSVRLPY